MCQYPRSNPTHKSIKSSECKQLQTNKQVWPYWRKEVVWMNYILPSSQYLVDHECLIYSTECRKAHLQTPSLLPHEVHYPFSSVERDEVCWSGELQGHHILKILLNTCHYQNWMAQKNSIWIQGHAICKEYYFSSCTSALRPLANSQRHLWWAKFGPRVHCNGTQTWK